MTKQLSPGRTLFLLTALAILSGGALQALAQDRFALAIGSHDNLVILGPGNERVEVAIPTIAKEVTVGASTFQISYGRDANDLLTAVVTPSSTAPQDLHFTVLNKSIDANKDAVVTLTFPDENHVRVDPGYVGSVTVNSEVVHHRELAADTYTPHPIKRRVAEAVAPKPVSHTDMEVPPASSPAPLAPRPAVSIAPRPMEPVHSDPVPSAQSSLAPIHLAPLLPGSTLPATSAAGTPAAKPASVTVSKVKKKFHWAGPITPPDGPPPSVGVDQMKLVQIHGAVTVQSPDGQAMPAQDGMIVPNGSAIITAVNSSAAVFMGGVNSTRFLPQSQGTVHQELAGGVRKTAIDLKKGTVFCRVGRRDGESQDFKVATAQGIAAARGTEFAVTIAEVNGQSYTVEYTKEGQVNLTDNSNGNTITVTPANTATTQVAMGSVPNDLPTPNKASLLLNILAALAPFNTNANSETVGVLKDAITSTIVNLGGNVSTTTTSNGNGTTTTTTTITTSDGSTITTSITTDDTTGDTVDVSSSVTINNGDGTTSSSTTDTGANGESNTNNQPAGAGTPGQNNPGNNPGSNPSNLPNNGPAAATGTLNSDGSAAALTPF